MTDGGKKDSGASTDQQQQKPFAVFDSEEAFNARMDREARRRLEAAAKAAGFDSVDEFVEAAKKAREAEEATKSELQKLTEKLTKAEQKAAAIQAQAEKALVDAEIIRHATALGFADPSDAVALLDRSGVKVDLEAGKVEGVKEAVEALLKAKPHLKAQAPLPSTGPTDNSQERKPTKPAALAAAVAQFYSKLGQQPGK